MCIICFAFSDQIFGNSGRSFYSMRQFSSPQMRRLPTSFRRPALDNCPPLRTDLDRVDSALADSVSYQDVEFHRFRELGRLISNNKLDCSETVVDKMTMIQMGGAPLNGMLNSCSTGSGCGTEVFSSKTFSSTEDVDMIVNGQLYADSDNKRAVYSERTAQSNQWGIQEYSSSTDSGEVGVDVGPYGLYEYGGKRAGYDDGIPAQWAMPSTPIRWYTPAKEDYYGADGPTVYADELFHLREPDHVILE